MSEMIERVARALCAADELDWDAQANALTSGSGSDEEQQGYLDKARAAIEAMREPTTGMLVAAGKLEDKCAVLNYGGSPATEELWDVMIDGALT